VRLGLRENRGQFSLLVAINAFVRALIATISPRAVVEAGGVAIAVIGFAASALFVRDTSQHVALEQVDHEAAEPADIDEAPPNLSEAFAQTRFRVPGLRACSQAGLVNNLNDGLAWGLTPCSWQPTARPAARSRPSPPSIPRYGRLGRSPPAPPQTESAAGR
jgi:hypothetical protein